MNKISNNKNQIATLVAKLLNLVNTDNYVIIPREKNKKFIQEYNLNMECIKEILKKINIDNYVSEEFDFDLEKYGSGNVVIFNVFCDLVNRFGEDKNVLVYIKFKMKDCKTVVISIHESE